MTVGKAIETADKLRPNNGFDRELKILWLRQADAGLRKSVVDKSDTTDFDAVASRTRAQSFVRSGRWEPQPGLQM